MTRLLSLLLGLSCVALLAAPARAAQPAPQVHKVTLTFVDPIVVGAKTLPAATYKLECTMIDGKEVMIFKSTRGVEVARVPCTPKALPNKVSLSVYSGVPKDGKLVLHSVQINGEQIEHVFDTGGN